MNADHEAPRIGQVRVAAVLVNWRQPELTVEAVQALARQTLRCVKVIVVDNGSGDGSAELLKASLPDALVVCNEKNAGFGVGCNSGIERALAEGVDYVWLVNNDAKLHEQCLEFLLACAQADLKVGAVGARICDPNRVVVDHAGTVMHPLTFTCRYTMLEVEVNEATYAWLTGASILLSVPAVRQVGLFDSEFFMYWEDADLCHRIRQAGFRLAIAPEAIVFHVAGTSSNEMRVTRFSWHLESQIRWIRKNYSLPLYGVFLVYVRHLVKSIISRDLERFFMTLKSLKSSLKN
ncbi:glycosyltransferase family 2 protein [Rhodoferax sp. PAMC 29310]|uniref:glycosyltransferase family 2 protein n=1 Tax=Rhodoferax sp. PAMC 29310 TaxID=2822760 RepID=UPI001B3350F9|nr:glycosyltransferase family 2 protein [Rhodoferax sp. PAMC 29310]